MNAFDLRGEPLAADEFAPDAAERHEIDALRRLGEVLKGVAPLVLLYMIATLFVIWFVSDSSLTSLVISWKIVSLAYLIYEHKESPQAIDFPGMFGFLNKAILVFSFIIITLMVVKLFVDDAGIERMPPVGQRVMEVFKDWSHYISMAPIFTYFLFDIFLFRSTRGDPEKQQQVMQFLIFKDLFTTVPLIVVFAFTEAYARLTGISGDQIEIFFSGSIAVIVFSSSIATGTLNEIHRLSAERAPVNRAAL